MDYETDGKQVLIGEVEITGYSKLRISKIENENGDLESLDIRQWYCTQKDSTLKPTKKGVRIKKENIVEVLNCIIGNIDLDIKEKLV